MLLSYRARFIRVSSSIYPVKAFIGVHQRDRRFSFLENGIHRVDPSPFVRGKRIRPWFKKTLTPSEPFPPCG
jgi:hypothetical protein